MVWSTFQLSGVKVILVNDVTISSVGLIVISKITSERGAANNTIETVAV